MEKDREEEIKEMFQFLIGRLKTRKSGLKTQFSMCYVIRLHCENNSVNIEKLICYSFIILDIKGFFMILIVQSSILSNP